MLFLDWRMQNSRVGRAWEATREDEDAAELMGVPTFRFKLLAFAIGAAIGGLVRRAVRHQAAVHQPRTTSRPAVGPVRRHGRASAARATAGASSSAAILLTCLPEQFRFLPTARFLVFGLALMALAIFRPQGLLPPRAVGPGQEGRRGAPRRSRRAAAQCLTTIQTPAPD